jgi:hypothetical protein
LVKYGEAVQTFAAIVLLTMEQMLLFRVAFHMHSDFSQLSNDRIEMFIAVHNLVKSSIHCAYTSLQPIIDKVQQS